MKWSAQQAAALDAVSKWLRAGDKPFFYLAGYAGTGKTTLAKYFAEGVGNVAYGAFTGKAASVMRSKGCDGATTIHRLIYESQRMGTATLKKLQAELEEQKDPRSPKANAIRIRIRAEIDKLKQPSFHLRTDADVRSCDLIVIDECSMVSGRMADDLMSFGVPILVLGDPGQLPPVGSPGFFTKGEPDFMLTEVHRQAKESGVLRLATMVREGQIPDWCDFGDAEVIRKSTLDPISVPHYDQILVGRNKTRTATNIRMRELLGRTSDLPQAKDRLVCLRNNHDMGLLNGEIYQAVTDADSLCSDTLTMHVESDDGDVFPVEAWKAPFRGEALEKWDHSNDVQEFDYGYTLTVHKAQGSQWPSVILFDQSATFRKDAVKWLYTGITRASERVTVVR